MPISLTLDELRRCVFAGSISYHSALITGMSVQQAERARAINVGMELRKMHLSTWAEMWDNGFHIKTGD